MALSSRSKRKKAPINSSARERILEVATSLFEKSPFDQISATQIAMEAGVAHGLPFHYFGSKAKLYEEVSRLAAARIDLIHLSATRNRSSVGGLRAFLLAHMETVWDRRADYVFHSRGGGTPAIQKIWEDSRLNGIHLVLGLFGVVDPSNELVVATRAWLGFFDELVLAWVQGNVKSKRAVIESTLRQFPPALMSASILGAKDVPRLPPVLLESKLR